MNWNLKIVANESNKQIEKSNHAYSLTVFNFSVEFLPNLIDFKFSELL
jgi:hypothetical protein